MGVANKISGSALITDRYYESNCMLLCVAQAERPALQVLLSCQLLCCHVQVQDWLALIPPAYLDVVPGHVTNTGAQRFSYSLLCSKAPCQ